MSPDLPGAKKFKKSITKLYIIRTLCAISQFFHKKTCLIGEKYYLLHFKCSLAEKITIVRGKVRLAVQSPLTRPRRSFALRQTDVRWPFDVINRIPLIDTAEGVVFGDKVTKDYWAVWSLLNLYSDWFRRDRVDGTCGTWLAGQDLFPSGTTFYHESVSSSGEKTRAVVFT